MLPKGLGQSCGRLRRYSLFICQCTQSQIRSDRLPPTPFGSARKIIWAHWQRSKGDHFPPGFAKLGRKEEVGLGRL